ncbi:MAG: CHAT domain-containing protein, partial [Aureispira sp.]|nr:CHAT domain-containing protein [Aureispira sp.]
QTFYQYEELETARYFLEKAEKCNLERLSKTGEAYDGLYYTQTVIYQELGDYQKALEGSLKSIKLLEKGEESDPEYLAYEYGNLASIYDDLKDYDNALQYYQKSLSLLEEVEGVYPSEYALSYYNIGIVYSNQDKLKDASKAYFKALDYLGQDDPSAEEVLENYINCYHQIASCYTSSNQLDSALFYTRKAEQINKSNPYRIQITYEKYGTIYWTKKDYKKAETYLAKALGMDLEQYGTKHPYIASYYLDLGKISTEQKLHIEALEYYQKALDAISLDDDFDQTKYTANPSIENILDKGRMLDILEAKVKGLQFLRKEDSTIALGDIYQTALLATEVLEFLNRSFKEAESKYGWLRRRAIPTFEQAMNLAVQSYEATGEQKYLNAAFQVSERSKSMLLMGAMQEANAATFGGVPDSLIQKEKQLEESIGLAKKARFDALLTKDTEAAKEQEALIFELEHELDGLIVMYESDPAYKKYYELKYSTNVASIEQVQAFLKEGVVLVEYFEGASSHYVFTIGKDAAKVEKVKQSEKYKSEVKRFVNSLMNVGAAMEHPLSAYQILTEYGHELYKNLLQNSIDESTQKLIVIPDGMLGYFPFEVLMTEESPKLQDAGAVSFATLPYLVKKYRVSYNYSGTLWLSQVGQQSKVTNGRVLAMAPTYSNPVVPETRSAKEQKIRKILIELPGAESEIKWLSEQFDGQFYSKQEANEATFKQHAEEYGILHMAMHGLMDKRNPEFSSLAMTEDGAEGEDNFLYAYEIRKMNLNAALVVLSACETGIGDLQQGEGIVSLGRSFMYAGAPSLLMTLWNLNDQSGSMLIERFYKNLQAGMEKDEALREAKVDYLGKMKGIATHPALWACFVQVGDYSTITLEEKKTSMPIGYILGGIGGLGLIFVVMAGVKRSFKKNEIT